MAKKKEVVIETQTDPALERFFTDEEIPAVEPAVEPEEPEEPEEEPESEPEEPVDEEPEEEPEQPEQPPVATDKFDGKSREEVLEAYKNLEALYGRQGQELGELKKAKPAEPPKEYDITNLKDWPESVLEEKIQMYETYLYTPSQSIDDSENFGIRTVQYNRMMVEKAKREAIAHTTTKQVHENNAQVAAKYPGKSYLTPTELSEASQFAIDKLSDDGSLTSADLDVAVHKLFPDKWIKLNVDKERVRMTQAQTKRTPMVTPKAGEVRNPGLKSPEELAKMDEMAYNAYLDTLNPVQLAKLQERINKRG
jgi:hypothetical protein